MKFFINNFCSIALISLATLLYFPSVFAQNPNWVWGKTGIGSISERGTGVSTDASGNVYVTGHFSSSTLKFGTTELTNAGSEDIFIVKYNSNGDVLWAKSFGGTSFDYALGITTDNSGNIYVTGGFKSTSLTFGSTTLTNNLGGYAYFIVKCNASGNAEWAQLAGGKGNNYGSSITSDNNGYIYASGYFDDDSLSFGDKSAVNLNELDMFVVKYDGSGNAIWANSGGGLQVDMGHAVAVDTSGNVFVTGRFQSPYMKFGSITLGHNVISGSFDMFIVKYSAAGEEQWAKCVGGSENDFANGISTDVSGNIYVTGQCLSTNISVESINLTNAGGNDVFVIKYNTSGDAQWAKTFGGSGSDIGFGISKALNDKFYITGLFASSTISFGSSSLTNAGKTDIFVTELGTDGSVNWARAAGGSGDEKGSAIALNSNGSVYTTGDLSAGSITFGADVLTNSGVPFDMFLAKIGSVNNIIPAKYGSLNCTLYPNPNNGNFIISGLENTDYNIQITDLTGRIIFTKNPVRGQNFQLENQLNKGMYFMHILQADKSGIIPFVVE